MDFLIYGRGAPAVGNVDVPELDERHWSYMEGYADAMTARGPTLGPDRQTWTGSVHVVDLPGAKAAREFVAREPYNQAGAFKEHFIWRFVNVLDQTMWQFAGTAEALRFLVLAWGTEDQPVGPEPAALACLPAELRERLIVYGELRDLDDEAPAGVALAVQAPTREALDTMLKDPRAGVADYGAGCTHDWEFGGRR